jgi:hypothetical protein
MVASPFVPFFEGYLEGFEDNFLEGVDGGEIKKMLEEIDTEKPNNT